LEELGAAVGREEVKISTLKGNGMPEVGGIFLEIR